MLDVMVSMDTAYILVTSHLHAVTAVAARTTRSSGDRAYIELVYSTNNNTIEEQRGGKRPVEER